MSTSEEAAPVRPGDVLADKYRVDRVLGLGGMGVVVAATHLELDKKVALKFMLPHALTVPIAIERFTREARAAVRLRSEHVAQVLDVGKLASGSPYMVMEFLEGSDLGAVLEQRGALPVVEAVDYLLQACEAVAEAHALGIVHRDLKPRNLFLTQRLDRSALVKVLDFGISKVMPKLGEDHALTRTNDVMGSPSYMSPEQIKASRDVDGRTDIWGLGVILYELLSGRVPFLADTMPQLCGLVLTEPPTPLGTLKPALPASLIAVVEKCLAKKQEDRFQTVADLATALESFMPARSHLSAQRARALAATTNPMMSPAAASLRPVDPSLKRVNVSAGTTVSWADTVLATPKGKRAAALAAGGIVTVIALAGLTAATMKKRGSPVGGLVPLPSGVPSVIATPAESATLTVMGGASSISSSGGQAPAVPSGSGLRPPKAPSNAAPASATPPSANATPTPKPAVSARPAAAKPDDNALTPDFRK
jgi:serine/threonine-protein kinase